MVTVSDLRDRERRRASVPRMRVLRLDLEYDGAGFAGWAAQPGLRTVEGTLRAGLEAVLRAPVVLRVAGRTDAGVHATGQVASAATSADVTPERLVRAMAGVLPEDLAVRAAADAPDGFDARRDARSRSYEYRILPGAPAPLGRGRVLHHPRPLDIAALRDAASRVVGRHDFRAFTPTDTQHVLFERTVLRCDWVERGDEAVLEIEADAFLRHMVRVLV